MAGLLRRGFIRSTPTSLSSVIDAERVLGVLRDDAELAASMLEHLPPSARSPAGLEAALRSPQLRQAAGALTVALTDPSNAMAIYQSFNLDPNTALAHRGDPVGALVDALVKQAKEKEDGAGGAAPPPAPP